MVFSLSALWWIKIRGLWKLPDGRDWLRGKLSLVLMGRSMLSKSLIQFSVDGWGCVPSLLFTWGQTLVEVMKIMVTFKRSHACTAPLSVSQPCSRTLLTHDSAGDTWTSWPNLGQSLLGSLLLSPESWFAQGSVPSKSLTPQPCVSSGGSVVGLVATS